MASRIAVNATVGLFAPIYSKIDPAQLGETARALAVARDYAGRFPGNLVEGALERLVYGYSSHSFVIDFEEAKTLFKNVREPIEYEVEIASHLGVFSTVRAIRESGLTVSYIKSEDNGGGDHAQIDGQQESDPADPEGTVGPSEGDRPGTVQEDSNSAPE